MFLLSQSVAVLKQWWVIFDVFKTLPVCSNNYHRRHIHRAITWPANDSRCIWFPCCLAVSCCEGGAEESRWQKRPDCSHLCRYRLWKQTKVIIIQHQLLMGMYFCGLKFKYDTTSDVTIILRCKWLKPTQCTLFWCCSNREINVLSHFPKSNVTRLTSQWYELINHALCYHVTCKHF